MFLILHI